jgi:tryptophan-rich sensory protein
MDWMTWYNSLSKPSWTPQPATIGLIWTILYPMIAGSFLFVLVQSIRKRISWSIMIPFVINLIANLAFTPIQFGLRNLPLATIDIVIVWSTIVWMMIAVRPYSRWVMWAQIPYLIWVSIATTLQISMTWLNRGT